MRVFAAILLLCLVPQPGQAQMSEEDQKSSCMGDAFRLCLSDIPDRQAVRQCLKAKFSDLSSSCKLAFNAVERGEREKAR